MNSALPIDPSAQIPLQYESPSPPLPLPRRFDFKARLIVLFLQLSHRLGAIALLSTLATWAMIYLMKDFKILLAVAGGTAEAGLCFALLARVIARGNPLARREANGVAIFNLVLFVLAIYLMLFTRLDDIRSAAGQFFSPSAPPQAEQQW